MAVKVSGNTEEEIMELASIGAHGTEAGHCHRDLERKYIKQMHKTKHITVRDVKGTITILAVDRSSKEYASFEVYRDTLPLL